MSLNVDPSRGPWWAYPSATPFWDLPVSQRAHPKNPLSGQPGSFVRTPSRPLRGFGAFDSGSCPDAFGDDPCAALLAQQSPSAAAAAAGLPTSWLTTGISSLGGIPGWALLAVGAGILLVVSGMAGGRRR